MAPIVQDKPEVKVVGGEVEVQAFDSKDVTVIFVLGGPGAG